MVFGGILSGLLGFLLLKLAFYFADEPVPQTFRFWIWVSGGLAFLAIFASVYLILM